MKPETLSKAEEILEFTNNYLDSLIDKKEFSLVFCPPFVFIEDVSRILKMSHLEHDAELGAQDIAIEDVTALTGEIFQGEGSHGGTSMGIASGPMLQKLSVRYIIVGHSERRWKLNETNEIVNKKIKSVIRNEMIPIVCIGEMEKGEDFSAGGGSAAGRKKFLENQVLETFKGLTPDEISKCIITYEPVWAISTNPGAYPDTPESALESIHVIKNILNSKFQILDSKFLYGGSVNSNNVADFLKEKEINGVLVGGASVNKEEFVKILEVVIKL